MTRYLVHADIALDVEAPSEAAARTAVETMLGYRRFLVGSDRATIHREGIKVLSVEPWPEEAAKMYGGAG